MWDPYKGKRSRGRPSTRWADYFNKLVGPHWSKVTRDRNECKVLGKQLKGTKKPTNYDLWTNFRTQFNA